MPNKRLTALVVELGESVAAANEEAKTASPRATVLISMAILERAVLMTLRNFLAESSATQRILDPVQNGALGTFAARVDMCIALGLLPERLAKCSKLLARIRNTYAHSLHAADNPENRKLLLESVNLHPISKAESVLPFEGQYRVQCGGVAILIAAEWAKGSSTEKRQLRT